MVPHRQPLRELLAANMALQRTRALAFARVRSLPSVAHRSPLNAQPLAAAANRVAPTTLSEVASGPLDGAPMPARRLPRRPETARFAEVWRSHGPLLPARALQSTLASAAAAEHDQGGRRKWFLFGARFKLSSRLTWRCSGRTARVFSRCSPARATLFRLRFTLARAARCARSVRR
jgi:hypothetical protein